MNKLELLAQWAKELNEVENLKAWLLNTFRSFMNDMKDNWDTAYWDLNKKLEEEKAALLEKSEFLRNHDTTLSEMYLEDLQALNKKL